MDQFGITVFSVNSETLATPPGTYSVHASPTSEVKALLTVLKHFNWGTTAVIHGESKYLLEMAD
jgi:hypothetical protein